MTEKLKETEVVCSATLLILGDELIPENVTAQLGFEPNQSWRKGEQKSFARNDGTIDYFDSVYEWGGWKLFISNEQENLELEEQLVWWCDILEGKESAMRSNRRCVLWKKKIAGCGWIASLQRAKPRHLKSAQICKSVWQSCA